MIYLKTYEELDIDKYKAFIKKYKKSDYISTKTIKTMKELGIKDTFVKIEKKVSDCYKFFNKQNSELLNDLFLYVEDDFNAKVIYSWFSLKIELDFPLKGFNLTITKDDSGLPSKAGKILDDEINVVDHIIRNIDSSVDDENRKLKDSDRSDSWVRWTSSRMRGKNFFEKVKIFPVISLQIQLNENSENDFGDEEYEQKKIDFRKKREELKKFLKEDIIDRYFRAMGYNIDFEISETNYNNYLTNNLSYDIKCKL